MTRRMTAESVGATSARLGEGPVWDIEAAELVWLDIVGCQIHRTRPVSGITTTVDTPAAIGAITPSADGWVGALPDGIYDVSTWDCLMPFDDGGGTTRANDGKADPSGCLVQGTMGWRGEPGLGRLYRIGLNGGVELLLSGLGISNGLDWTDAGDEMYHIDTPTGLIRRHPYRSDGPLGPPVVAVDLIDGPGDPDGMCLDADGAIWVALWGGGCVHRYTPDGRLDTIVEVPTALVSSCSFGGVEFETLFITTADGAGDNSQVGQAGRLFAVRPGPGGKPAHRFGARQ